MKSDVIEEIVRAVAELLDRSSPADFPEAMLVTADELRSILTQIIGPLLSAAKEAREMIGHMTGVWPGTMSITARRVDAMLAAAAAHFAD